MATLTRFYIVFILVTGFFSCKSKQPVVYTAPDDNMEEELLDTLVISDVAAAMDSLPKEYRASATLAYDIIHTRLDLKFDWQKQHVIGKASLTVAPYFKPVKEVSLDAIGFIIHEVKDASSGKILTYTYDNQKLKIELSSTLKGKETAVLDINYTARPNENVTGGSEAITSDKGLFFIDPLDQDPDVPSQIWTQGETENNSRWFPTFDKPNERFSQEIILTVDKKYATLSNGRLISSTVNGDGSRTDHWKQDRPHAPYLAMIAVGDYHVQQGNWKGLPLSYYVEKPYAPYAEKIFDHTPEMLEFFSNKLNYPYPWDKYGQIIVRDFVSGAMENTGAVVFGDFVQKTERELIDDHNDNIVAHEMMHHWFGDLVTCESWSNLTLNEGFANYAEYLWNEHKYGRDMADYHRLEELNGYMTQVYTGGARSLIDYHYEDKEQMFDAHSYNKGGLVLHMLRAYLGDEAFFAALSKYLKDNEGTSVETDELRMAFEDTTGEDLNWFFDQWFHSVGHPLLEVTYTYNPDGKVLLIEVDQSKTPTGFHRPFILPVEVAVFYGDGSVTYHPATIDEEKERILIEDLKADPVSYILDGRNDILALINENKTPEQYKAQFRLSPNVADKITAFTSTGESNADLIDLALADKFYAIRIMGISAITDSLATGYIGTLKEMAIKDPHSSVRGTALSVLLRQEGVDPLPLCKQILDTEKAYPVLQLALEAVGSADPIAVRSLMKKYAADDSDYLAGTFAGLIEDESPETLDYLESKARKVNINYMFDFFTNYGTYLNSKSLPTLQRSAEFLKSIGGSANGNVYRKYLAVSTLIKIAEDLRSRQESTGDGNAGELAGSVSRMIADIVKNESDPMLRERYGDIK